MHEWKDLERLYDVNHQMHYVLLSDGKEFGAIGSKTAAELEASISALDAAGITPEQYMSSRVRHAES